MEFEQLQVMVPGTPAQQEALSMHFEIMAAAQTAASSLLDLGRKLKRMRDTGRYKDLGFDSFGAYTETAVGIRQRQAYTYITVVEKLPAQLIEENAAAGVTKLALLAKLGPEDREEIAGDGLANITVAELQKLIEEKNGLAEQLSMLQVEKEAAGKLEAARKQAAEEARREQEERYRAMLAEKEQTVRAAQERAEELAKQMKLAGSPEGVKFAMMFDDMQQKAAGMMDLIGTMLETGKTEDAQKYKTALAGALRALAQQAEEA